MIAKDMAIVTAIRYSLLAIAATSAIGCASCAQEDCDCGSGCSLTRRVAAGYHGELADDVICCGGCLGQSCPRCYEPAPCARCGPDCYPCPDCRLAPFGFDAPLLQKPWPGPPPVRLRPAMPPKFLPVPTEPTLSPVPADAPEPERGDVEVGYGNQLTFPGRD